RIAVNATPDSHRGFEARDTLFCSLALSGGGPMLSFSGGQADEAAVRPRCDIARLPDGGMRYRLAIPWALLRRDPARRPGDFKELRLGLAVFDNDGGETTKALEWGAGVSGTDIFAGWLGQLSLLDVSRKLLERYKLALPKLPYTAEARQ